MNSNIFSFSPIRKNVTLNLIGNVIYAASQWAIFATIAKTATTEAVGLFSLGFAINAPIAAFTNLQLRGVYCSDAKKIHTFSDFLFLRIFGVLTTTITASTIGLLFYDDNLTRNMIFIISIVVGTQSLSDIVGAFYQKNEGFTAYAVSKSLKGILSFSFVFITMLKSENIFYGIGAIIAGYSSVLLFFDFPFLEIKGVSLKSFKTIQWTDQKKLFFLGIPMGLNMMMLSISVNFPRYVIENNTGKGALGIFCAMVYLPFAGTLVMGSLSEATLPRLAERFAKYDMTGFWRIVYRLITIASLMSLFGIFLTLQFGKEILFIFYTPEYSNYGEVFLVVIIASCVKFYSSIAGVGVTATRSFKTFPFLNGVACIVSISTSLLFVPKFGIMGGAISMLISSLTGLLLFSFLLLFLTKRHIQCKQVI